MTSKHKELAESHWELAQIYKKGGTDTALIADYWQFIEQLEEELGVEK